MLQRRKQHSTEGDFVPYYYDCTRFESLQSMEEQCSEILKLKYDKIEHWFSVGAQYKSGKFIVKTETASRYARL